MRTRRLAPFCAAAVVGALVPLPTGHASPAPAAGAAVATCQGEQATIAPADRIYQGTDGPDVIVVDRTGMSVYAGGGDDLICIDRATRTRVDAGAGADEVLVRDESTYEGLWVFSLGPGDDTFEGGPGDDKVTGTEDGPPT